MQAGEAKLGTENRDERRKSEIGRRTSFSVTSLSTSRAAPTAFTAPLSTRPRVGTSTISNSNGRLQRVEVKGTVAAAFTGVDITANELQAARTHGSEYWLYLVAGCLSDSPRVQAIPDPASKLASLDWTLTPTLFSLTFTAPVEASGTP